MAAADRTPLLVGRDRELAILDSALARARESRGGAAIIEGEAGIGKTRLALELRRRASDAGFLVAGATSYESGWSPPFALWLLVVAEIGQEALAEQPGVRRSVLLEAMPDLRDAGSVELPPTLSPEEARLRATDAVARLLLDVAEREPLLVVLDDLQWADPASLEVLAYLARFLPGAPLLVLGAYRTGGVGLDHLLARTLGELDRQDASVRVQLGPLSDGDALALVECLSVGFPPHVSAEIVRESNGHPFFITEVVRHLLDEGSDLSTPIELGVPPSVRDAIALRLARLAPGTRQVLAVAAAFTRPFEFCVLAAMTDLSEEEVLAALDEALRSQLLRSVARERYEFSHALIRKALYDDVGPSRRARLHRRIAQALERVYAGHELDQAGELAAQYHASVSLPGAAHGVRYALAAADAARAAHAHGQAVAFLRVACDLAVDAAVSVRSEVVCRRAVAEAEALLLGDASHSADEALALLEAAGADPELVADFVVAVARPMQQATIIAHQHHAGGGREAVVARLVERGLSALGDRRGVRWARLRLLERPKARDDAGPVHSGRWLGFDPEAVAIARASGDEDDYASTVVAQDPRSPQEIRELLDTVDGWVTPRAKIWGFGEVYLALLLWHGGLREAVEVASRALAYSEEVGSLLGELDAVGARAAALERLGEFDAAVADARRADELLARLTFGDPTAQPPTLSRETRTRHWQSVDWAAFGRFYRDSALDSRGSPSLDGLMEAALAAYSFAQAGEVIEARRLLGWVLPAIFASEPTRMKHNGAVCFAGAAVWELGDAAPAGALRRAAVEVIAAGVGDCWWTSNELTVARMSSLLGEFAETEGWFERARVTLEASGQRPLRAVVEYDEARHRLRHRLPGAGPVLAAARRRFDELGMPEWLERVDRLAGDGGVGHPDGLTAREVEVLGLLAGGHTNAEIAATLVISVHTVERHLANAYRKIGVRNRAEAAGYALRSAL